MANCTDAERYLLDVLWRHRDGYYVAGTSGPDVTTEINGALGAVRREREPSLDVVLLEEQAVKLRDLLATIESIRARLTPSVVAGVFEAAHVPDVAELEAAQAEAAAAVGGLTFEAAPTPDPAA